MIVEILCGGYGCPTKTGVHTVAHGERCEVSDAEAARLIGLGVAKCAFSAPTAPETAPADVPATAEGNDTPAAEASQNGSEAAHLDPDQLQSMIEDVHNSNEVDISAHLLPLNAIADGTFS